MDTPIKKNKEETKKKLIQAAGEIFMIKGYHALNAAKIANAAGVSKTLIYRYFGNVQELFKAYLIQKDYWISLEDHVGDMIEENRHDALKELAKNVIINQMNYFFDNAEMQQIVRWQISESNDISRSLVDTRERLGEKMLEITDHYFKNSDINFRALLAIMISGTYYLVLNAKVSGSAFCAIDINKEEDFKQIQKSLTLIVDWAYENQVST